MKASPTVLVVVALLAIGSFVWNRLPGVDGWVSPPSPAVTPVVPSDVPDLTPVMQSENPKQAREHALIAARFCAAIAEAIRQDQALETPGFQTGVELNDLRLVSLQYLMKGWKFSDHYKDFDKTVGGFMGQRTAGMEGQLTLKSRESWAQAFDDLSAGFHRTYLDLFKATGGK